MINLDWQEATNEGRRNVSCDAAQYSVVMKPSEPCSGPRHTNNALQVTDTVDDAPRSCCSTFIENTDRNP